MKKKQTAVEWLWNLTQDKELEAVDFEQALKIEKEQMKKTWQDGFSFRSPYNNFEHYYNETYGKETDRS